MSPKLKIAVPIAIVIAVVASGCAKPEDKFVGHYTGALQLTPAAQAQLSQQPPQIAAMLKSQVTGLKIDLDIRKDRSYTVNATIPGGQAPGQSARGSSTNDVSDGTWTLAGNKLTLTDKTETVNGKAARVTDHNPEVLVVGRDPKILTADMSSNPNAARLGNLVFTKAP